MEDKKKITKKYTIDKELSITKDKLNLAVFSRGDDKKLLIIQQNYKTPEMEEWKSSIFIPIWKIDDLIKLLQELKEKNV